VGGIALEALTAEHVDGLYRELEHHVRAAGTCRTVGVTCKANHCSPDEHNGLAPKSVRHVHTMLRWSEVDLDRGRLRIAQTITEVRGQLIIQGDAKSDAAERSIGLDTRTIETLRRWNVTQAADQLPWPGDWPTHGLVFTQSNGLGYRPKRLSSQFTTASDPAGLPRIGAHGLRHPYATAALRAGVSPEVVSKRLGHASVVLTLSIYAHVFEQDEQAAAELTARAIVGA
jgi:integrase